MLHYWYIIVFSISFLSANQAFSKDDYYRGVITLTDGQKLQVYTQIPAHSKDRNIKYKLARNASPISISGNEITSIRVSTNSEKDYEFFYATCQVYNRDTKSFKQKSQKLWLYLDFATKHMSAYAASEKFSINEDGEMNLIAHSKFDFYVKKATDTSFLLVYRYGGTGKKKNYLNECLSEYCKDVPALAQDIAKGVYPWDRLYEIVAVYNWHKEKEK